VTREEIFEVCAAMLRECAGFEQDEHSQDYKAAWDYYLQRLRGDEIAGRSTAVAGDVSASVEANLAQMLDAFASDSIAEFDPLGAEDEQQASLESDVVTYYVMKTQNGFLELASAIKNALVARDAIMKIYVETFQETATRVYSNVAPEVHELVAPDSELLEYDPDEGELRTRETRTHKRFRARCVDNANFFFPKNWDSQDFQECPGVFERHEDSRSELLRLGFPAAVVSRLTPVTAYGHNPSATAKNVRQVTPRTNVLPDPALEVIEWFEGYVLLDVDDDGIAERRRVCFHYDDGEVMSDEPEELVLYAKGVSLLMPNRASGISQYDKLRQNQDEHTGLKRALYDNVNTVTKNRLAYLDGPTNSADVEDGRPNGAVRVRKGGTDGVEDIRAAIMPLQVADNSANILANIDALKRERAELGGAALDLASAQAQVGGPNARLGSQGLDRAYSAMEQLAAMMTKTVACTLIRSVWLLAHAVIRREFTEPVQIRTSGGWQAAVPAQWRARNSVTVRIGMSPGERARMAGALERMLDHQMQLAQLGMDEVLVSAQKYYRTMMQWCRVSDLRNPEQYWVDPQSPEAQQALKQKQAAAQDQAQKRQSLMDRAIGFKETGLSLDKYKHDSSLQHEYWSDNLDADVEEAKIVGGATERLLTARESVPKLPKPETAKGKAL
jgi:hypothetical protein